MFKISVYYKFINVNKNRAPIMIVHLTN